jgi:DNA-binding NarL/FixJ family response regulator
MKNPTIKVFIVAGAALLRAGMRTMLAAPDVRVVGEAEMAAEALRLTGARAPHLVLIGACEKEAEPLELLRQLKERHPKVSVIMIMAAGGSTLGLSRAIALGCSGYLGPKTSRHDLLRAVRAATRGECVLEPALLRHLLRDLGRQRGARVAGAPEELTVPEREVLHLVTEGQTNRQIAQRLGYSVGTVKDYVQKIIQKLEVSDRTQAAVKAVRLRLFE